MEHYDVIIIGTGAGGGTLAHKLAPSGKKILLLERGGYLPREPENWSSREVFRKERYLDSPWHALIPVAPVVTMISALVVFQHVHARQQGSRR